MLESEFYKKRVKRELEKRTLYYFVKEAASIRGIPDIVGCYNGKFFALELKKNKSQASKKTGRIVQQKHNLHKICKSNGVGFIVYPENLEEVMKVLDEECARV